MAEGLENDSGTGWAGAGADEDEDEDEDAEGGVKEARSWGGTMSKLETVMSCSSSGRRVTMPEPRGRKSRPTIASDKDTHAMKKCIDNKK